MDGGVHLSSSANLNNVLIQLEENHDQHVKSRLGVATVVESGHLARTCVVTVEPADSLLIRLFQRFFRSNSPKVIAQREAASILHDQTLLVLSNENGDIEVKNRIIALAEKKLLPFLSKKERQEIVKNRDVILCSATERRELRAAAEALKFESPLLLAKIPRLTLEDCRSTLQHYFTVALIAPELIPANDPAIKMMRKIEKHFNNTRQPDGFQDLMDEIISGQLKMLKNNLSDMEYQGWLDRVAASYAPQRDDTLKRALRRVTRNALVVSDSIHGHPRERVHEHLLQLLYRFNNNTSLQRKFNLSHTIHSRVLDKLDTDIDEVATKLGRIQTQLQAIDLPLLQEKLGNLRNIPAHIIKEQLEGNNLPEHEKNKLRLTPEERRAIAECRKTLLDIQLSAGRRWDLSVLLNAGYWSPPHKGKEKELEQLLAVDTLRGPAIDEAQMEWMLTQHDQVMHPLSVVIEGAGPTGLLTALTQFIAGANVSCFEQRSTKYDRVQVVRLDPLWMNMLKFYLGEEYYQLFGDASQGVHEGKGVVREDGFGEIVTFRLEEALHDQLQKVISYHTAHPPTSDRRGRHFELIAAHQLAGVEPPKEPGEKYKLASRYNPRHDLANPERPGYQTPNVNSVEADLLVCAGGKNSHLRNQLMGNVNVSGSKPYGVCSWELEECHTDYDESKIDFKSFEDFRGMIVFDEEFHTHFAHQVSQEIPPVGSDITEAERAVIERFQALGKRRSPMGALQHGVRGEALQTRCFENKGLIYIGMEVPSAFDRYLKQLERELHRIPLRMKGTAEDNRLRRERDERVKKILQHFQIGWFQAVAHSYRLDQEGQKNVRCTHNNVNRKFASVFHVQQDRVQQNVVVQKSRGNDHELMVTAAGDAAAAPHFLRYSGLTGARENILNLQDYTKEAGRHDPEHRPQEVGQLRQSLKRKSRDVARFVRERGDVFLGRAPYWHR